MTTLQNLQSMTRARMARLSLPDIRAYAKAYKVPAAVVERGTADELLDFIFKLRPCHPKQYPINTLHTSAQGKNRIENWGGRSAPVPPLDLKAANDLGDLTPAPEEQEESQPKPSRVIVDDELFDLEFTPDMTQEGKEAIIFERCAIAMSNHKMVEKMLVEAENEVKQALWQLAVLQPQLYANRENMQRFVNEFRAFAGHSGSNLMRETISNCMGLAKDAWELDWNEEWIFTEEDEKEEERMREIAQARAAGIQVPSSPSPTIPNSPSRKRFRDEYEDELEYADEDNLQDGTSEPYPKRPRAESRETSAALSSPSPKRKGKALSAEDSYTLPFPSSSFHIPPSPMPRFGPKDRCNIYPVFNPAVPGYELPKPSEADGGESPGKRGGSHFPPSDTDDSSDDGQKPDPGQGKGRDARKRNGEDRGHDEVEQVKECDQNATQMPLRGAPLPTRSQPEVSHRGDPWQVFRYGRLILQGYIATDHTQMPSELKRPVNWSVMGSQHPKGANYREWDDELEEQNPWHQGGRPILNQYQG